MGIISRFSDIMSANLNALLSKSEDANSDKLLDKYLADARNNLSQVKAETAAVIADEMALARKLQENDDLHKKYEGYAQAALQSGNDDDAKKFVSYQMDLEQKRADLSQQYDIAKQNSEKMREMTTKLTNDIHTAQSKLDEAKAKLNVAKQQENLNEFNQKFSEDPLGSFNSVFDEVQKRVDKAEAAASLNAQADTTTSVEELAKKYDVDATLKKMSSSVDDRLAQMKASLSGGAATNAPVYSPDEGSENPIV